MKVSGRLSKEDGLCGSSGICFLAEEEIPLSRQAPLPATAAAFAFRRRPDRQGLCVRGPEGTVRLMICSKGGARAIFIVYTSCGLRRTSTGGLPRVARFRCGTIMQNEVRFAPLE